MDAFKDRVDAATYRDDVTYEIRLVPDPRDANARPLVDSIPERLLVRLKHLAIAYELPLLSRLPVYDQIAYPEQQLSSLEDELAFLFEIVSDEVLSAAVAPLHQMVEKALHDRRGWTLHIEGP